MEVKFAPSFLKDLRSQPIEVLTKVDELVMKLQSSDSLLKTNLDIKKMKGKGNYYRIRPGSYRIIGEFIKPSIILLVIGSRGDVYK
jgi:mRNA-degrading endonuclease RelE of RelBE toxin-antitoxin system